MGDGSVDAKATLPEPSVSGGAAGPATIVALTILFHPDTRRVGERALLQGASLDVSRNGPRFAPPRGGEGRPLDEPHLSRKPFSLTATDAGVTLDASATSTSILVRGRPVTRAAFSAADLRHGAVLLAAGRVALLLHRVSTAPPSHSGEALGLFGESDGLRAVLAEAHSVADIHRPVLLRGDSGSGKELVARAIHELGPRRSEPFVAVNLGAVPTAIAAAELFGSERGAFTGAVRRRGYFEQAERGTLFLDEIGEAPVELQAALLRVLQDSEIQPVGAERARKVDVRVVAATDADLESRINDGSFRAPLLNRLAAYQIWIPPLRERKDDIGRLLVRFLREELREIGEEARLTTPEGGAPWLSPALAAQLADYAWPGNVRQLRNVIRHLVIGNRGQPQAVMTPAVLKLLTGWAEPPDAAGAAPADPSVQAPRLTEPPPRPLPSSAPPPEPARPLTEPPSARRKAGDIGEEEIAAALREHRWEIAAAAKKLGIPRPSLHLAMKRFPRFRTAGDLRVDEIEAAHRDAGGDIVKMADRLEVSERALLRRVRELGLTADRP